MAIDIRATVTCSLGTLISGSISDDYVQGTGLIKCKGSCEINGIITPAVGTAVTFSYTKGGVTRQVPRKLRVLSSFADPFRRTTQVELGCKLTYLQDLQEPLTWDAFDDPENTGLTDDDAAIITIPIYASSVGTECLSKLGITSSGLGLTNRFSIAEFDFGAGYVSVLSDLLVSESRCGYLDKDEVLQVFSLDQQGGTGPVIDSSKIIDLGPIGVGQLPAEAVVVSYSTLKLRNAQDTTEDALDANPPAASTVGTGVNWESESDELTYKVPVAYTLNGTSYTQDYNVVKTTETTTTYGTIKDANGEDLRVVVKRVTEETGSSVEVAGKLVTEYLSNGITFPNVAVTRRTEETYRYDASGNENYYEKFVYGDSFYIVGSANVPFVLSPTDYVSINFGNVIPLEGEKRYTVTAGGRQKVKRLIYGPWSRTINGQQTIASANEQGSFTTAAQSTAYLNLLTRPGFGLIDIQVNTQARTAPQLAPDTADINNEANVDKESGADPANGWRTESSAELELALGSPTATRRIELSMPYAPDDRFYKVGSGASAKYAAIKSDAPAKAARYGRSQNRLLLGNRSGMNLQVTPELLPDAPFAPIVVQANGLSAMYRLNGTSWQMSSDGILASTDALFYGAVGGTGTFWFPVAPGVTTLPTTPAVVGGQMTVSSVTPVWNETVATEGRTRLGLTVTSLPYALEVLTAVPLGTVLGLDAERLQIFEVPSANTTTIAAATPVVRASLQIRPPAADIAVAALTPSL